MFFFFKSRAKNLIVRANNLYIIYTVHIWEYNVNLIDLFTFNKSNEHVLSHFLSCCSTIDRFIEMFALKIWLLLFRKYFPAIHRFKELPQSNTHNRFGGNANVKPKICLTWCTINSSYSSFIKRINKMLRLKYTEFLSMILIANESHMVRSAKLHYHPEIWQCLKHLVMQQC